MRFMKSDNCGKSVTFLKTILSNTNVFNIDDDNNMFLKYKNSKLDCFLKDYGIKLHYNGAVKLIKHY